LKRAALTSGAARLPLIRIKNVALVRLRFNGWRMIS
jgi:hypothetical protein